MANGAKVCSETCDHDLHEDTTMPRAEFVSQRVLRKKSHDSDWIRTLVPACSDGRGCTLMPLWVNSSSRCVTPCVEKGINTVFLGTKAGK